MSRIYSANGRRFPLDPASYMDLLRRAYTSIKAACPSVLVISGTTTPAGDTDVAKDDIGYLRGMYQNGLANYSDGVGIHPSGFANPPDVTFADYQAGRYDAPSHVTHRSFYFKSTLENHTLLWCNLAIATSGCGPPSLAGHPASRPILAMNMPGG